MLRQAGIVVFALLCAVGAQAAIVTYQFNDAQKEERFQRLSAELRCLVCQNQSLADSNAELAQDLRRELYHLIQDDATDQEIIEFMVSRYGDFVLYRPPVKTTTILLWIGPILLAIVALVVLLRVIRRGGGGSGGGATELSAAEQQRLQKLLKGERGGERG